jgi:tetratricopeptide (TPR) repeat protein
MRGGVNIKGDEMSQINWLEVLKWGPQEMDDLRFVAYSYIKQGVYDVALTFLNAVCTLTQPTAYDLQTIGALYLQKGEGTQSLEFLDRALQLEPAHLPTQLNRAKALFLLGYKKQGLILAAELEKSSASDIASQASAMILAYS